MDSAFQSDFEGRIEQAGHLRAISSRKAFLLCDNIVCVIRALSLRVEVFDNFGS